MDGFAGVGGNVIQFARYCKVLAVDIDTNKLEILENNAKIYGVNAQIQLVNQDFLKICERNQQVDVVFASPPWGGPGYLNRREFDINWITPDIKEILRGCEKITRNAILYLPKNLNPLDIYRVLMEIKSSFKKIEFQTYYLGKNIKGIACLLGDIVRPDPEDIKTLYSTEAYV